MTTMQTKSSSPERRREQKRQNAAARYATSEGKELQKKRSDKYLDSEKGKQTRIRNAKKYVSTPETRAYAREWMRKIRSTPEGKALMIQRQRKYMYGITDVERTEMLVKQRYLCAICQTADPGGRGDWKTDHCHNTGTVRGFLCHHCNLMLGHAKDNVQTLHAAINYLKETYV